MVITLNWMQSLYPVCFLITLYPQQHKSVISTVGAGTQGFTETWLCFPVISTLLLILPVRHLGGGGVGLLVCLPVFVGVLMEACTQFHLCALSWQTSWGRVSRRWAEAVNLYKICLSVTSKFFHLHPHVLSWIANVSHSHSLHYLVLFWRCFNTAASLWGHMGPSLLLLMVNKYLQQPNHRLAAC